MGLLQKIGKGISHAAGQVGHVVQANVRGLGRTAEELAPYVGMIPGVGTVAGAAIGGLGSVAAGHNIKHSLGAAVKGGIGGYLGGGGGLGGMLSHIPGVGAVEGALSHVPGAGAIGSGLKRLGGAVSSGLGGGGGVPDLSAAGPMGAAVMHGALPQAAGDVAQAASGGGGGWGDGLSSGLQKIGGVNGVLGAGAAYEGLKDKQRQAQLEKAGLAGLQGEWNNNSQVRDAGRASMLQGPPNLDNVFANQGDPYFRPLKRVGAAK